MNVSEKQRSWLVVPMSKPAALAQAAQAGADVVVLDLVEFVSESQRPAAQASLRTAIAAVGAGGAQVYVQTDPQHHESDLRACVWPGVSGVVVSRAESAAQIGAIDQCLLSLEAARDLVAGSIHLALALETARGNQDAYEIATASRRVRAITLGRADLVMDLRAEPGGDMHLMPYLMQRLIIIARAAGVTPLGAWWRAPDRGLLASADNTLQAAQRGRAAGFKGALCLHAEQIAPLNNIYA